MRSLVFMALMTVASAASAALGPFDSMVMPGKVIKAHRQFENDCSNCHVPFSKEGQQQRCVACHDHADIAQDIAKKRGYHGHLKDVSCKRCHTEHKGRDAKIVHLNIKEFDHNLTEFPLRGGHTGSKIKCADCHAAGKKFRDAPHECIACHRKDDKHKGGLGTQCVKCHEESSWKKIRFDHSKTGYELEGKHITATCVSCHIGQKYKNTPRECYACHKRDDDKKGHKGRFGRKCDTCHMPEAWDRITFDHARQTHYPLLGKHADIECRACHTGYLYKQKLPTQCNACHRKDDVHKGQEGEHCEQCHDERSWKRAQFDHGLTRFPLLGKHRNVRCNECHKKQTYKDAPLQCAECHLKDDKHKRRLGIACAQCHNANSWKQWSFDHNKLTKFALEGKHERLDCLACHKKAGDKIPAVSSACVACHAAEDVHDGAFGRFCEQCHVARSFKELRPGFQSMRPQH